MAGALSVDVFRATTIFIAICCLAARVFCTNRYYGSYLTFGTGDDIIETYHMHGGTTSPIHKWNIECLDGEAVIGIRDTADDFQRIQGLWCKFMFPYKPPSSDYPYYPGCYVRNFTTHDFCYDPRDALTSPNSFMTGLWDNDFQFQVWRITTDYVQLFKCCATPANYYIDYMSCYYKMTHDQYWEYYDHVLFLMFCDTGYVVTGLGKKHNPYTTDIHLDWIQCCRVGFGPGRFPVGQLAEGLHSYGNGSAAAGYGTNPTYRSLNANAHNLPNFKSLLNNPKLALSKL
ncbi:uncharacterized protein LOC129601090 [Paramacrobiotus metropolitanus]|uniref:uncharacterized protein LOC129601090 n=1 Tax=Paramacrobiotus metropolitanus TaxID=2943436 RepID=UPI002445982E|nr:uncharacterized protein LOC129601090 [Paramacrobiotus metropolitanus]